MNDIDFAVVGDIIVGAASNFEYWAKISSTVSANEGLLVVGYNSTNLAIFKQLPERVYAFQRNQGAISVLEVLRFVPTGQSPTYSYVFSLLVAANLIFE